MDLARELIFAVDGLSYRLVRRQPPSPDSASRIQFNAGSRILAGHFVPAYGTSIAAILLCHGIGDRMEYWQNAQSLLARNGIDSMIFHYSGYLPSEGKTTPENLEADAQAAYAWMQTRVPAAVPLFLFGFSLGSGIATQVVPRLSPQPAGLILCQPYTSLRHAADRMLRRATPLTLLLPDIWRTVETIRGVTIPVLLLHSDADTLFPVSMAKAIRQSAIAAGVECTLRILHGHRHNAVYLSTPADYWDEILNFMRSS